MQKIQLITLYQFITGLVLITFLMLGSHAYGRISFMLGLSIGISIGAMVLIVSLQAQKNVHYLILRVYNGWNKTINDFEVWRDSIMKYLPSSLQDQFKKKEPEEKK